VGEEIVVPFRFPKDRVPDVSRVRSTLITSSLQALKRRSFDEMYFRELPDMYQETIRGCIAGTWLPAAAALAHYETVDRLPLSTTQRLEIGTDVSQQVQGSVLQTVARMATGVGVTPWTGLSQFQRLWDRLMDGGAVGVYRVAQKEARVEIVGLSLVRVPYFRTAFRAFIVTGCELFATKVYGYEVPKMTSSRTVAFRLAWA
jgi:hypothetical protein